MTTVTTPLTGSAVMTTATAANPTKGVINIYDATNGAISKTLPQLSSMTLGARLAVQKFSGDSSTNTVTLSTYSGDTFVNTAMTSVVLSVAGEQRELQAVSVNGTRRWAHVGSWLQLSSLDSRYVSPGGALGTPSSGTLTNCTGLPVAGITASTSTALGVGSVELGHASDTTLSRVSAGVMAVEGNTVVTRIVVSLTGTANLAATAGAVYIYLLGSGAVPTLPTAVGNTSTYNLKNTTTGNITLTTTSSQTVDGNTSIDIQPNESYTIVSDNANWWII